MKLTCRICGFVTLSYEDMIRHLSFTQKYPEENCKKRIISLNSNENLE